MNKFYVLLLENTNECQTPNGIFGECIEIQQCRTLFDLLKSPSRSNKEFLRSSQCGFHGHQPFVSNYFAMLQLK